MKDMIENLIYAPTEPAPALVKTLEPLHLLVQDVHLCFTEIKVIGYTLHSGFTLPTQCQTGRS